MKHVLVDPDVIDIMEFRYTTTPKNICFDILSNHHRPFSGKNSETEGRLRGNDERIQCVLATNETMQVLQFLLRVGKCHGASHATPPSQQSGCYVVCSLWIYVQGCEPGL